MRPNLITEKNDFISFARGFSILAIVFYHFLQFVPLSGFLSQAYLLGGSGIYVFLFASGYGLYFSKNKKLGDFYKKRLFKVLIPYFIGITCIYLLNKLFKVYDNDTKEFLSHLFLYKMFYGPYNVSFGYHFWFISTIVQFYLIWPATLSWINKNSLKVVLGFSFLISILYSYSTIALKINNDDAWRRFVLQYFWVLVLGAVVAKYKLLDKIVEGSLLVLSLIFITSSVAVKLLSSISGASINVFNDYNVFLAFSSACIIIFKVSHYISIIKRFIFWVESFSYSLYILHLFILLLYLKFRHVTFIEFYEIPLLITITMALSVLFNKTNKKIIKIFNTR